MESMSTKKLISALNAACRCSDYNGISISFLSAEDYCIDKNTPTELCSYGHIKMSPYLTAVRNYSFEQTYVEGVDFGDCDMLEEIGTSHHSCLPDSCLHVFMSSSLTHSLTCILPSLHTYSHSICLSEQYAFYDAKIQELDLLACTKLHSIRYSTFAYNEITKIKLPKSIEKIDSWVRPLLAAYASAL
jgi:hypothetical protein